jgi:hypothetical protein
MSTWGDLIQIVFRDSGVLGVGQTLQAQDTQDGKRRINMMLSQWKRRRWLVYHLVDYSVAMTGARSYTFGAGGNINAPRTDAIESAFVRQVTQAQPNQPDYPLRLIKSYEDYSQITMKGLQAGPSWALFYDSGYPLGTLYPWPLANSQYELHVQVKNELVSVDDIADEIVLPPEYEQAIYAEQVRATRAAYRLPSDPYYDKLAKGALETLRSTNFQIGTLSMPRAVMGRGAYDINSDTFGPWGR